MNVIGQSRPRARVAHRCHMCSRTIRVGELYDRQRCVDGRDAWTFISCRHCSVFASLLWARADYDYDDGMGWEALADFEPGTPAEERLQAMWRAQWSCADDTVLPLPRLVKARMFYPQPWRRPVDVVVALREAS